MKLFIKKYCSVLLLSLAIYSLFFIFREEKCSYLNYSFAISIIISILIRLIDDYIDYEKDVKNNRVVFGKKIINILVLSFFILSISLIVLTRCYLFLIVIILLIINLYINKYKSLEYIKALYIPVICFCNCFYYLGFNIIYLIFLFILFIGDLILIYRKR